MSYIGLHMHSYVSDDGSLVQRVDLCLDKKQNTFIAD